MPSALLRIQDELRLRIPGRLGHGSARRSRSSAPRARRATTRVTRQARELAPWLGHAGLRDHHRRRPGDHGGREPRRARRRRPARSGSASSCRTEQGIERVRRRRPALPLLLRAQGHVRPLRERLSWCSPAASGRSTSSSRRRRCARPAKIRHFPIVLVGLDYWGGLLDWLRDSALADGYIWPGDVDALSVCDDLGA